MPMMQDTISVAANSVSTNVLAGKLFEFVPAGTNVTVSMTAGAAGMRASFLASFVQLLNDEAISTANRFPVIPDDIVLNQRVGAGRLLLTFRNSTAGALSVFWRVDVNS
jgi:hypothetical protein